MRAYPAPHHWLGHCQHVQLAVEPEPESELELGLLIFVCHALGTALRWAVAGNLLMDQTELLASMAIHLQECCFVSPQLSRRLQLPCETLGVRECVL